MNVDPSVEHRLVPEDSVVLANVTMALRRDLATSPWYQSLTAVQQSALTAEVAVSLNEILPGFSAYIRAVAVENAIADTREQRGLSQPIGSQVEGSLIELAAQLETFLDQL